MMLPFLNEALVDKKPVLVRVDLNVPIKEGKILDDMRLIRMRDTVEFLREKGAKILLLSHFGRPNGQFSEKESLRSLVEPLAKILGQEVVFIPQIVSEQGTILVENSEIIKALPEGGIALFENTRFYKGEEENDALFAKAVAAYGEIFVNDAFSASHRAHASIDKITDFLPSYGGFALQKELEALHQGLEIAQSPIVAIVGGAKISTKIALLENLVKKVDMLVIGGGMANSFLFAEGIKIGRSLHENQLGSTIDRILMIAREHHCTLILPTDAVVAYKFAKDAPYKIYGLEAIPEDGMILDLGPQSIQRIKTVIDASKTLLWNGPLGAFELTPFDRATIEVAQYAAKCVKDEKLLAIAGGGDTVAALRQADVVDQFSYVSTGGGAFLEWLEGKTLPGIAALKR